MSLIYTPPILTPAQNFCLKFQKDFTFTFNFSKTQVMNRFNSVWNNPDQENLSPDKAWQALGTNAVLVRHSIMAIAQFVNSIVPNTVSVIEPTDWNITENKDGSITAVHT